MSADGFATLATAVLFLHLLWIAWVIFGWLATRGRPVLSVVHVGSLVYAIVITVGRWPCPLTTAEQWLQRRAGGPSYEGGFIAHYLEAIVYPDVPEELLVWCATAVCLFNLGIYGMRLRRSAMAK
jgi:hypothetical protein